MHIVIYLSLETFMKQCKSCNAQVNDGQAHDCPVLKRMVEADDSDFLLSVVVGSLTDSAIIGGLVGGDIIGGIVGDVLDGDLFD